MTYTRPRFVRQESWRYKRLKDAWRIPRGKSSRVRRSKEGWPPIVKIGYSRPKSIRGKHPSGLNEILVSNPKDLEHVNSETHVVRIAHTVGEKKRSQIIDEANVRNLKILNPGKREKQEEIKPLSETEPEQESPSEQPSAEKRKRKKETGRKSE